MNRREWLMLSGAAATLPQGSAHAPQANSLSAPPDKLLLKDYRPRSIYKIPKTEIRKAKYPIFDAHHHASEAKSTEQLDKAIRMMDAVGVEKSVAFVTTGRPEKFSETRELYSKYLDRFDLWCGFDLSGSDEPGFGPNAAKALEDCHRLGALGVGEVIDKGRGIFTGSAGLSALGPHVDDPRMDLLYNTCARLGMPINTHIAEPIWTYKPMDSTNDGLMNCYTWRTKMGPGVRGHNEMIESLERAVKKHPGTTFIACHLANLEYDLTRLGQILDRNPNLHIDIANRFAEISPMARSATPFFEQHQDRILYGTDMPYTQLMFSTTFRILESSDDHFYIWDSVAEGTPISSDNYHFWDDEIPGFTSDFDYHWPLYGLAIPDDILRKVYGANARKVFQTPRDNAA